MRIIINYVFVESYLSQVSCFCISRRLLKSLTRFPKSFETTNYVQYIGMQFCFHVRRSIDKITLVQIYSERNLSISKLVTLFVYCRSWKSLCMNLLIVQQLRIFLENAYYYSITSFSAILLLQVGRNKILLVKFLELLNCRVSIQLPVVVEYKARKLLLNTTGCTY